MAISVLSDLVMRDAVQETLADVPGADAVGVAVDGGIVMLTGTVASAAAKFAAEDAARRVAGARAVANDLAVRPSGRSAGTELARAIVAALAASGLDPDARIGVGVQGGWVDLTGAVSDDARRLAAATLVRRLPGVKGVVDELTVPARAAAVAAPPAKTAALLAGQGMVRPVAPRREVASAAD